MADIKLTSTSSAMIIFLENQGMETELVEDMKSVLANFKPVSCKSQLEILKEKIIQLNGAKEMIKNFVVHEQHTFLLSIQTQARENIDKIINDLKAKFEFENYRSAAAVSKFSNEFQIMLSTIECFTKFDSFIKEHNSESTKGNLLEELKWQVEVIDKREGINMREMCDYLKQQIYNLEEHVSTSMDITALFNEIDAQSENINAIRSRNEIVQLLTLLEPVDFQEKFSQLTRFGFSEQVISWAIELNLNTTDIQKIVQLLTSKFRSEISTVFPTENSQTMRLFDRYVVLSEVLQNEPQNNAKVMVLMASRKLLIDTDLHLKNTHLILMAPLIEIENLHDILLIGDDGENHPEGKARSATRENENGSDGLHGNPGYSSGSLSIFALDVINPTLQVRSYGGSGGDGQDGGDGKDGELNERAVSERVTTSRILTNIASGVGGIFGGIGSMVALAAIPIMGAFTSTDAVRKKASLGGKGGDAGVGASAGTVEYFLKRALQGAGTTEPRDGSGGKPGISGKDGLNPSENDQNNEQAHRERMNTIKISGREAKSELDLRYKFSIEDRRVLLTSQMNTFNSRAIIVDGSEVSDVTKEFIGYLTSLISELNK